MSTHYTNVVGPEKGENGILVAANANFVQLRQRDDVILFTPDQAEEVSKQILLAASAMVRAKAGGEVPTGRTLTQTIQPRGEPVDVNNTPIPELISGVNNLKRGTW